MKRKGCSGDVISNCELPPPPVPGTPGAAAVAVVVAVGLLLLLLMLLLLKANPLLLGCCNRFCSGVSCFCDVRAMLEPPPRAPRLVKERARKKQQNVGGLTNLLTLK